MDAIITGRAEIFTLPIVLTVFEYGFLGGSMGSVVGEKIARAFDLARRERVPTIVICSSGGARIQEGMVALFQMAKTAYSAARLRERGVPLITVLCDPTMGGVLASFASLGDVIIAEPHARVSFVGPRVHQANLATAPPGTAEFALEHGTIDAIIQRASLRRVLGNLTAILMPHEYDRPRRARRGTHVLQRPKVKTPWETLESARHPSRPTGRELANRVFSDIFEIHGDRAGEDDDSVMVGIGRLYGLSVVVVAQDRNSANTGRTRPSGYRKAQRAFSMAERFRFPLITLIDTPGAATDSEAEGGGITAAIAESLAAMALLSTPVISVVVGEGGSGGALALSVADRLLMLENAIFSVIRPEAASAILYGNPDHAQQLTPQLKVTAGDLLKLHLVDRIVVEQPAGNEAPEAMAAALREALIEELAAIATTSVHTLLKRRDVRLRRMHAIRGRFGLVIRGRPSQSTESA